MTPTVRQICGFVALAIINLFLSIQSIKNRIQVCTLKIQNVQNTKIFYLVCYKINTLIVISSIISFIEFKEKYKKITVFC